MLTQQGAALSRHADAVTDALLPALCAAVGNGRVGNDMRFSSLKVFSDITTVLLQQGARLPCVLLSSTVARVPACSFFPEISAHALLWSCIAPHAAGCCSL